MFEVKKKICGYKEKCFEQGNFFEDLELNKVSCKHLSSKIHKRQCENYCLKYKEFVELYCDEQQYNKIKL